MRAKLKQVGLIGVGVLVGAALTLNYSAVAEREVEPLPIEDLRAFTEIFGKIKADYVEPVEDKKLITEAINGMLAGLDPHSAYLDAEAFKDLQVGTQGEFGGLGLPLKGHTWQDEKNWGYKSFTNAQDLTRAYVELLEKLHPLTGRDGLSAAIYTQTTDVEIEVNGLMTYDRAEVKMDVERIATANRKVYTPPPQPASTE